MQKKKVGIAILIVFLVLFSLVFVAAFSAYIYIKGAVKSVVSKDAVEMGIEKTVHLEVLPGMPTKDIAEELEAKGLIRSAEVFYIVSRMGKLYYRYFGGDNDFSLKSGSYTLKNSMDMMEIMRAIQTGKQEDIIVVFPEGITLSKIAQIVENHNVCSKEDFIASVNDKNIINDYGFATSSLEGCLFPDTYFFVRDMQSESVVRMMVDNFFSHINDIEEFSSLSRAELYDKVILASIIEREYRVAEEAPVIASVFVNRLAKEIRLQSCATIEYIITEIEGLPHPDVIHYKDLWIESPYNTYREKGLPPSPISNPGFVALKAAAKPAKTNYYYFRLTNVEEGRHTFSETFDEHANVNITYTTKAAK